jgi:serine/threonine protein phosphatase PrpC
MVVTTTDESVAATDGPQLDVLHPTLKYLAAYPNQFQSHAQASLRVLDRRRRRVTHRAGPCGAAQRAAAGTTGCADNAKSQCLGETRTEDVVSASGDRDKAVEAENERPVTEVEENTMQQAKSDPMLIKEIKSAPEMQLKKDEYAVASMRMPSASSLPLLDAGRLADWPREVRMCLDLFSRHEAADGNNEWSQQISENLRLVASCFQVPHPRKADTGGEDSLFITKDCSGLGVADGVGEWEWRFKVNPRAFADELMDGASSWLESEKKDATISAQDSASIALNEGYAASKSFGSATALVAVLDAAAAELGVANLGDSGFRQVRHQHSNGTDLGTRIVGRTQEQQHGFNFPYQLARLPEPDDFQRLIAEGKGALVRAVRNSAKTKQDKPQDADSYTFPVKEGDLLLLGSDGVFDNLTDREICQLTECTVSPFEAQQSLDVNTGKLKDTDLMRKATDPSKIAAAISLAAFHRSRDTSARTPFATSAKEAGLYHHGGKMDDITVVAAWVVRT